MGGCLSNPDPDLSPASNASSALLGDNGRASSYSVPAAPAPARRKPKVPTFKQLRDPQRPSADAAAAPISVIFCACGGPGSLVQLLPCAHHALCMACAQKERACPVCGAAVSDSKPSFKAAKGQR